MERLGRVWTRLSINRPTLPLVESRREENIEDDLPDTKNESSASNQRKSDPNMTINRIRSSIDSSSNNKSSSPHRKPLPTSAAQCSVARTAGSKILGDEENAKQRSKSPIVRKIIQNPTPPDDKQSSSFHEESYCPGSHSSASHSSAHKNSNSIYNGIFCTESTALSHVSSRSKKDKVRSNSRRNSVFVKRGSITMEPIQKIDIEDVYTVYKQLGTGRFGYIKLAEHKQSKQKIAIKFFPRPQIKQAKVDFIREYNYSFFLSPHPHIIDTYEGMYQTGDESAFFFVQQLCPKASLREAVEATNQQGIGEKHTKMVFSAVLSAIEFMHNENLVHRNLKAENILLFDSNDFSKTFHYQAKITDFGLSRKVGSAVKYLEYVNNYHAPELCETLVNEKLIVGKSVDIWALDL
ncbi:hypothetical protein DICVIV_09350 [Dictyocaulus viviparus]|uniref:Protein kinase domain-containing protein n=1 Tax=Dictyocaulus viviparus TaxID=29172 RepID=A0A0D8XLF2_DICVI|nr:hypothetical protein DICVIV_09350 [Dictyocaulus viviparus]